MVFRGLRNFHAGICPWKEKSNSEIEQLKQMNRRFGDHHDVGHQSVDNPNHSRATHCRKMATTIGTAADVGPLK